jgi:hypothetical protein
MFLAYVPLLSAAARGQATTKTMLAQGLKPHALAVLHIGKHAMPGLLPRLRGTNAVARSMARGRPVAYVGRIRGDQIADWGRRMAMDEAEARRALASVV